MLSSALSNFLMYNYFKILEKFYFLNNKGFYLDAT